MVHEPHDNLGDGVAGEAGMPAEALHASEPAVTDRTPPTPAEIPNTTISTPEAIIAVEEVAQEVVDEVGSTVGVADATPTYEDTNMSKNSVMPQMGGNEAFSKDEILPKDVREISETAAHPAPSLAERLRLLQKMAYATLALRREKRYQKILTLLDTKTSISTSDVVRILRVSRATAIRYLDELERRQHITQVGEAGRSVAYRRRLRSSAGDASDILAI